MSKREDPIITPEEIVLNALAAINAGRAAEALSYYHEDVRQFSPSSTGPELRERRGKASLRQVLVDDIEKRNVNFKVQRIICEGKCVAIQCLNTGRFEGSIVEQPVAAFFEVEGGLITTVTVYYDRHGLRKALGSAQAGDL